MQLSLQLSLRLCGRLKLQLQLCQRKRLPVSLGLHETTHMENCDSCSRAAYSYVHVVRSVWSGSTWCAHHLLFRVPCERCYVWVSVHTPYGLLSVQLSLLASQTLLPGGQSSL